jgi:hypothetical protein
LPNVRPSSPSRLKRFQVAHLEAFFVGRQLAWQYHLTPLHVAEMPAPLREFQPWAAPGWFEEDCDWTIVALALPQFFWEDAIPTKLTTLKHFKVELFAEAVALMAAEGKHSNTIHYADGQMTCEQDVTLG